MSDVSPLVLCQKGAKPNGVGRALGLKLHLGPVSAFGKCAAVDDSDLRCNLNVRKHIP